MEHLESYGCDVVTSTERVRLCPWYYFSCLLSDSYLSVYHKFQNASSRLCFLTCPSTLHKPLLLSGIEEAAFHKYLKFSINLFVSLSFNGRLAVSQVLTQL